MRNRMGYVLMAIAVLHEVVGLFFYSSALAEIAQAGFINAINPPYWQRDAAFWFFDVRRHVVSHGVGGTVVIRNSQVYSAFC